MEQSCGQCGKKADLKCSSCKLVWYCNRDHQKANWKAHAPQCRPYQIINDPIKGKCLVANRDLNPGDQIITEEPLVFGPRPHMIEDGPVPCPGCCRLIIGPEADRCRGCDFPVCHRNCDGLKTVNQHGLECYILGLREGRALNEMHAFYRQDILLLLRCLLLQVKHPKKYQTLLKLEAHPTHRGEGTEAHRHIAEKIVPYLEDNFFGPLRLLEENYQRQVINDKSAEIIHRLCGIIDVNAMEINQEGEVSALYACAALMEHNCVSNTVHSFGTVRENYRITVRAAVRIACGDPISTMYTHALWGTQARREHLRETKYFQCACLRCSDPTELGTFLSALKCLGVDCAHGTQLPLDPLDDATEWVCDKCPARLQNGQVAALINQIGEEVDQVQFTNPTIKDLETLLTKLLTFLHPNHYHTFAVKHSLIQLYGYQAGYTTNQITDENLQRKITFCEEILNVLKALDPGSGRLQLYEAVTLHELHLARMVLIKRKWDVGIKSKVKSVNIQLQECKISLENALRILHSELDTPSGSKLYNLIEMTQQEFQRWLERNKVNLS